LHYKVTMPANRRYIATLECLFVFPASLFMLALFLRDIQPPQYEPAHAARRVVDWYSARPHLGLDLFLIALPFAALVIGCATVLRSWRSDPQVRQAALQTLATVRTHLATLLIVLATLIAGGILAIVALHMITD
jgi:hypothetical protein